MIKRLLVASGIVLAAVVPHEIYAATAVPVAPFRSLELRGGGHVTLRPGPSQRVMLLEGSTEFTRFHVGHEGQLVIDACDNKCPGGYDLTVEIVTPHIEGVAIDGGGKIESRPGFGRQPEIGVAVQGGGEIDVRSIEAERADAAVDGGGDIALRAGRTLHAAVNGGGNIAYWGNPAVTSAVSGGGNISKGE